MTSEETRREYAARQYESLRAQCARALEAQHKILQWNQAVAGTLFAAALVAGSSHLGRLDVAAQIIFAIVLPAILLGGALAWAGEMIRTERVAVFLRAFERTAWGDTSDHLAGTSFFIWENLLWSPPKKIYDAGFRKQNTGYVGIAVYFGVMYLGSLVAFCVLAPATLAWATCAILIVFGAIVMTPPTIQIFALGGAAPTLSDDDLAAWAKELASEKSTIAQSATLTRFQRILIHFTKRFHN